MSEQKSLLPQYEEASSSDKISQLEIDELYAIKSKYEKVKKVFKFLGLLALISIALHLFAVPYACHFNDHEERGMDTYHSSDHQFNGFEHDSGFYFDHSPRLKHKGGMKKHGMNKHGMKKHSLKEHGLKGHHTGSPDCGDEDFHHPPPPPPESEESVESPEQKQQAQQEEADAAAVAAAIKGVGRSY